MLNLEGNQVTEEFYAEKFLTKIEQFYTTITVRSFCNTVLKT